MPKRPSLHFLPTSNASQLSLSTISRKTNHLDPDHCSCHPAPAPRRPSFSMDSIFHHAKDKGKRNDSKDREASRKDKRMSLSARGTFTAKDTPSPKIAPVKPGTLKVIIESPPVVMFGSTASSTGALLSGRLKLDVTDPVGEIKLTELTMLLRAAITTKRPVQKDCSDCQERYDDLFAWTFLSEPKKFQKDQDNQFPFSFLLPGHLPATTSATLGSIAYYLEATAKTSSDEKIKVFHPLTIQRAIAPGPDKTSIRIFPPTNLTGRVVLPPVIHPIGTFPVQMTMSGVVEKKHDVYMRWRLRKLMWRIDENIKMVSAACPKHTQKLGGEGKAVQNNDTKTIGSDELKHGWKTDFDTMGGEITMEFEASLNTSSVRRAACDVDSPAGLEVTHTLVIELIVAEEFCPLRNTNLITPTGSARVLRMQFAVVVTERAGMGISWDEEMPPVYDDVPASPPGYGRADGNDGAFGGALIEDYHGPELEYIDLERMHSDNPNDPPTYRERDPAEVRNLPIRSPALGPIYSPALRPRNMSSGPDDVQRSGSWHVADRYRPSRWTEDDFDFGAEPPQLGVRNREDSNGTEAEEDVGVGEATI